MNYYDKHNEERRLEVARQIVAVQKSLCAFEYGDVDHCRLYWSRPVERTMKEAEKAFAEDDFDRAEYLAKVTAKMVQREAPKFAANPAKWIERWQLVGGLTQPTGRKGSPLRQSNNYAPTVIALHGRDRDRGLHIRPLTFCRAPFLSEVPQRS
jgi:hypothetical protein